MKKKEIFGVVFLFIILIILGMFIQQLINKPKLKIHTVDIWGSEFEEGDEINLDFIYTINIPTDKLTAQIHLSNPYFARDCFDYQFYKNLTIFDIKSKQRDYWDIYVKNNISEKCFREYELEVFIYGMGLQAKKTKKFSIVPKDSYYCKRCESICG